MTRREIALSWAACNISNRSRIATDFYSLAEQREMDYSAVTFSLKTLTRFEPALVSVMYCFWVKVDNVLGLWLVEFWYERILLKCWLWFAEFWKYGACIMIDFFFFRWVRDLSIPSLGNKGWTGIFRLKTFVYRIYVDHKTLNPLRVILIYRYYLFYRYDLLFL